MTRQEQHAGRADSMLDRNPALVIGLQAAVPLWILELASLPADARQLRARAWAKDAATEVSHRGDVLQYGSRRSGAAAKVFNYLARGLAAAAYQPGGVTAFGQHWCVDHAVCEGAAAEVAAPRVAVGHDPDADAEPDDAGEWYGTRRVESIRPAGEFL